MNGIRREIFPNQNYLILHVKIAETFTGRYTISMMAQRLAGGFIFYLGGAAVTPFNPVR
ncbi:MAG: hypothetical protein Q8K18_06160 [Burkholderiales bacterium]|nr:hypothetical protein [Burkholderiales bacterium]